MNASEMQKTNLTNRINSNKIQELKVLTKAEKKIATGSEISNIFKSEYFISFLIFVISLGIFLCLVFFDKQVNKIVCGAFQSVDDFEGDIHTCLTCGCLKT